ncbi:hypothetical protein PG995_016060 [Apiospora arundinis]
MILRFADSEPNELQRCFANGLLQAQEKETCSNELAALICGILLTAASDTVAAELSAFVQAIGHPHGPHPTPESAILRPKPLRAED